MSPPRETIAVQTNVVMDVLVTRLHERALALSRGPAPAALDESADPALARAGYFARVAEVEWFAVAREPGALGPGGAERAAELAALEPLERPDPDHPTSSSWRVPGPGGHVRHYVALRAASAAAEGSEERRLELKRAWMFGFYLRCLEEEATRAAAGESR